MSSSSGTKRSIEGDENEMNDAKRIKGLDGEDDNVIWREPRIISDLDLVVHFANDKKIVCHVHRFVMMQHSGWFTTTIQALEAGCKTIEMEAGTGPFKRALDVTSFVDAMYKGYREAPVDLTGGCNIYTWMHTFDYFECKGHLDALRFRIHRGSVMYTIPMRDRIELARRFKWEELATAVVNELDETHIEMMRTEPLVAVPLAAAMMQRIVKLYKELAYANEMINDAKKTVDAYFDSCMVAINEDECADGDDCECQKGDHAIGRGNVESTDFNDDELDVLFALRNKLRVRCI